MLLKYPRQIAVKNGSPNNLNHETNDHHDGQLRYESSTRKRILRNMESSLININKPEVGVDIRRADANVLYPIRPTGNLRAAYSEVEGLDKYADGVSTEGSSKAVVANCEKVNQLTLENNFAVCNTLPKTSQKTTKCKDGLTPFGQLMHDSKKKSSYRSEKRMGKRVGNYRLIMQIGHGNFSKVQMATHNLLGIEVAVKVIDASKFDANTRRLLSQEFNNMERLDHPNIIQAFETLTLSHRTYLVMEYAPGGELHSYIKRNGRMEEKVAKSISFQILSAIDYMHKHGIVHRDLKAENVLFLNAKHIKVGDFGFSKRASAQDALTTFCGSPPYAAPELFVADSYIGPAVDVWALGVLTFYMVVGCLPFRGENIGKIKRLVLEGQFTMPSFVSQSCCDLIHGLLKASVTDRYTVEQIRSSAWFTDIYNVECSPENQVGDGTVRNWLRSWWLVSDMELDSALQTGSNHPLTGVYRILRTCGKPFETNRRPVELKLKQSKKDKKEGKRNTSPYRVETNTDQPEMTTVDLRNAETMKTRVEKGSETTSRTCSIL